MQDPQQELFSSLLVNLKKEYPDRVYEGLLPSEDAPYPFVYLADSQQVDDENKTAVFGTVYQTIHVYSNNVFKRGTVSKMLLSIKTLARILAYTESFAWTVKGVNQRIISDNTTGIPLLHGIIEIEFYFTRR